VFVATLARSSDRAKPVFGASWKRLHRLVWFTVPLSLAHGLLASGVDSPNNLLFVGLIVSTYSMRHND
jgi:DMSO/TMAO reductase YedYZ heme-binding membrane subunit